VYFNPAAMTKLPGIQVSTGILFLNGDINFTPTTGPMVEGDFGSAIANPPPTNLYITANLGDLGFSSFKKVTLGMGVNSPFGNLTNYPTSGSLSPVLTSSAAPIVDFKPTLAIEINEILFIGFGLDIYTFLDAIGEGHVEFQQSGSDLVAFGLATSATDKIELNGTDTALGFNVSLLFTLLRNARGQPILNLAFVYRSHTELELEGQFINQTTGLILGSKASLNLPQIFTTGVAVWPIRNAQREWKIEFDLDYAD
jgi:long-chain fatty acid transport protein